ncbi:hypothetical protein [Thermoproteus tenax]|uniref:Uncharacterized protein n=1 Tax=Thermoproteus tenax (strain ATCC 35583 / DSM 2078 / JCM 9277 / NBRC 100435 / Kra 1) TaxID=768679 RepID=G4RKW8_THETK|nr:hypothetical protein [Thermoproteus tenax]CCC82213.1 hypothetical protein predicted by Glimmer/Critica [Thermoproteus tenax Kra 1]
MSLADRRRLLSEMAIYFLEELALRGGRVKAKYWHTYRIAEFWLGKDAANEIVKKLAEASYLRVEGDYVVLIKTLDVKRSLSDIERRTLALAKSLEKLH